MRIHLEITGKCNLNCIYCYNSRFNKKSEIKKELKTLDWIQIIKEANFLKCRRFTISGGEPLLNNDLEKILTTCGSPIILFTNATLLSFEKLEKIKKIKQLKAFRISLDGINAHNKYRLPSKSLEIVDKIKLIKNTNIGVGINTQFSEKICEEIIDFYKLLKELKINYWSIDFPFFSGKYNEKNNSYNQAIFNKIINTCGDLIKIYLDDGRPFNLKISNIYNSQIHDTTYGNFNPNKHPCCYEDIITVRPNGDLTVCPAYSLFLSNIKKEGSLEKAIKRARNNSFYKLGAGDIENCKNCRYFKLCGSGCRGDAVFLTNKKLGVDPISCSFWPLVEKYIFPILPKKDKKKMEDSLNNKGDLPRVFSSIKKIQEFYKT